MLTSNGYTLDESARRLGELEPVPRAERSDRDRLWQRLDRDGYLYLPGHLDADVVTGFRRFYFESLASTGLIDPSSSPVEGRADRRDVDRELMRQILFHQIVPSAEYQRFCRLPDLYGWFSWLFDDAVHLHKRKLIRHNRPRSVGGSPATQAHYDLLYLRGGSDRVLSVWIPLGDCPATRGGLIYLEDSHRWAAADESAGTSKRPPASMTPDLPGIADELDQRWLVTDFRSGDVVIHTAYIVHAALDNVDNGNVMRLSTDIRYQSKSEPIDWRWTEHWNDRDQWRWRVAQLPTRRQAAELEAAEPALLAAEWPIGGDQ